MVNDIIENIQNPAFCSVVLWRFICGYYTNESKHTPFPLLFIVLPIALREDVAKKMISTQKGKGLLKFVEKFTNTKAIDKKNDLISSIGHFSLQTRELTLQSIRIGISTNLFFIDQTMANCFPLSTTNSKWQDDYTKSLLDGAEKLGFWCSQLTLHEISRLLKVRF